MGGWGLKSEELSEARRDRAKSFTCLSLRNEAAMSLLLEWMRNLVGTGPAQREGGFRAPSRVGDDNMPIEPDLDDALESEVARLQVRALRKEEVRFVHLPRPLCVTIEIEYLLEYLRGATRLATPSFSVVFRPDFGSLLSRTAQRYGLKLTTIYSDQFSYWRP